MIALGASTIALCTTRVSRVPRIGRVIKVRDNCRIKAFWLITLFLLRFALPCSETTVIRWADE
jgi:hypothetical protein